MKILLTGATGFLGSHLLKMLLANEYDVTILKRSSSDCGRIANELDKCRVYNADQITLCEAFQDKTFDAVIHCATDYGRNSAQASDVVNNNLVFPLKLLDTAIRAKCPYFINTDSFYTKQLPERFCDDRELYVPEYTLSKYQFKEWGRMRAIEKKINFINLQMEHIYGMDDGEGKFFTFILRSMQEGVKELNLTDGIQIRDFIHVEDATAAYLAVLNHLKEVSGYCCFEVGTGNPTTLKEFVEEIHAELGAKTRLNFGKIPRKDTEIMCSTAHPEKLLKMNWKPKHLNIQLTDRSTTPMENLGKNRG